MASSDPHKEAAMRVLAVEDNEVHAYTLQRVLESHGFDVLAATNGLDAVAIAERERPEIILLDIELPDIDGYEVCRRLKGCAESKEIPVIIYTAHDSAGSAEARSCGAAAFLTYPVSPNDLLHVIHGVAAKAKQTDKK